MQAAASCELAKLGVVWEALRDQVTYILASTSSDAISGIIRVLFVLSESPPSRVAEGRSKCRAQVGSTELDVKILPWGSFEAQRYGTLERTSWYVGVLHKSE